MNNTEKYEMLSERNTGVPSVMGIIPSSVNHIFSDVSVRKSFEASKNFELVSFNKDEEDGNTYHAVIKYLNENYEVDLSIAETSSIGLDDYGFGNQIEESDFRIASGQPFFLETNMFFRDDPLVSFHLQLKVMNAIVPEASLAIDFTSYRLLSAQWLKMTAKSDVPPSPDYLYSLHAVYNEDPTSKKSIYWFHTHGLLRCGTVELEIMGITDGAQQMNDLITMAVKKFLSDPAMENEKFKIGYDGMGINLAWLRWEEALKDFPDDILGGIADRNGEDNVHAEPSGILFAIEDNNFVSPQIYVSTLADNPIYYISNEETSRMRALAIERYLFFVDTFRKNAQTKKKGLFRKIMGKKEDDQPWGFLVKLGLIVDQSDDSTEKEHLWFEVQDLDEHYIEGKLLNQPYWISGLNEGDLRKYPVELLTDWIIYGPDNTYTTDSIYQLGYN